MGGQEVIELVMRWAQILSLFGLLSLAACQPADLVSNGPLAERKDNKLFRFSDYGLLETNQSDAIRVIISPSFGVYHYAFDVVPMDKGCRVLENGIYYGPPTKKRCGNAMVYATRSLNPAYNDTDLSGNRLSFKFVVSAPEYEMFYLTLKSKMDGWRGAWQGMTDGTGTAIELHSRGKIYSYHSNLPLVVSPDNPAAFASLYMRTIALAYAPIGLTPRDPNWTVRPPKDKLRPEFRCAWPGMNESDPDGYGIGNDICAKTLAPQAADEVKADLR